MINERHKYNRKIIGFVPVYFGTFFKKENMTKLHQYRYRVNEGVIYHHLYKAFFDNNEYPRGN